MGAVESIPQCNPSQEECEVMRAFLSAPHDQAIVVLVGGHCPELARMMASGMEAFQVLLIVDCSPADQARFQGWGLPPRVVLSCGETIPELRRKCWNALIDAPEPRFSLLTAPATDPSLRRRLDAVRDTTLETLRRQVGEVSPIGESLMVELMHGVLNMPFYLKDRSLSCVKGVADGIPAVVVGAGPSLGAQLPWLRENIGNALVVAVGSARKALRSGGIEPDVFVETDVRSVDHWEPGAAGDAPLACAWQVSPHVPLLFENTFWFGGGAPPRGMPSANTLPLANPMANDLCVETNTGLAAAAVAAYLGSRRIILLGIDLCLSLSGESHSAQHSHGSDKLASDEGARVRVARDNRGRERKTIFTGFINAFETFFDSHPEVSFTQASADGVSFKAPNTAFMPVEEIHLEPVTKPDLKNAVDPSPRNYAGVREFITQTTGFLRGSADLKELDAPGLEGFAEAVRTEARLRVGALRKWWRGELPDGAEREVETRFRGSLAGLMDEVLPLCSEMPSDAFRRRIRRFLTRVYPEVGVVNDLDLERRLLAGTGMDKLFDDVKKMISLPIEQNPGKGRFKVAWQRRGMAQVRVSDDSGSLRPTVGFYDLLEKANMLVVPKMLEATRLRGTPPSNVICVGVLDGNHIQLLRLKWPSSRIVVVEPDFALFAELCRWTPLISALGENSILLFDDNPERVLEALKAAGVDAASLDVCVICPDPEGTFFPSLKPIFNAFKP